MLAVFFLTMAAVSADVTEWNNQSSRLLIDNRITKSGDLMLGAIFSVHTEIDRRKAAYCSGYDFPALLEAQAMIYQVDKINMNRDILPEYTLGYEMMDDCAQADLTVKAATMFLMGETPEDRRRWIVEYRNKRMDMARGRNRTVVTMNSPKVAIIGPSNSDLSAAVASMTSVNLLPVISYAATSTELSQKKKYPSFLRTIPSDALQVSAMADLIRHFNWTWISAIGTDDIYGQFGVNALKEELMSRNICLTNELLIDYRMTPQSILNTLNELFNDSNSQRTEVIVLICAGSKVNKFFKILKQQGVVNKTWIASESWGFREMPVDSRDVVAGALGLVVDSPKPQHFIQYMNRLTVGEIRQKNPWLYAYLIETGAVNGSSAFDDRTLADVGFRIDPVWYAPVVAVMNAVKATAISLHREIHQNGKSPKSVHPIDLLKALRSGVFLDAVDPSLHYRFDRNGDVSGGYRITNLRSVIDNAGCEMLRFDTVGEWIYRDCADCECAAPSKVADQGGYTGEDKLCLDEAGIIWPSGSTAPPESTCQKECPAGTYRIWGDSRCCWSCSVCPANEYTNVTNASCCKKCPKRMINNDEHTECVYRSDYADWKSVGELVAMTAAAIGICITLITASILFMYRRTPVVICSNAPLIFILLYLLASAFTLPPLYVFRPNTGVCIAENIVFGWTFSTITAIFFTKTYHVLQIFTAKLSQTLHLLSQRGLQRREIWLSLGLGAAVLIPTVPYLIVREPLPTASDSGDCGQHWVDVQLVNMAYIALLSLATTCISFRARNLPENYNEAHTMATTMLMLMLIWVSSLPSYYRVSMANRALILGLAVDAAAFCVLALVFGPKLYLIYFEPHKNTPLYVSRMNMIHIWKQQSKKRISSSGSRRTESSDFTSGSGSSPVRKRLKTVMAVARNLHTRTSNTSSGRSVSACS